MAYRLGLPQNDGVNIIAQHSSTTFRHELFSKSATLYANEPMLVALRTGGAKLCFFEDGEEFIVYNLQPSNITILDESCAIEFLEDSEVFSAPMSDLEALLQEPKFASSCASALVHIVLLQRQIIRSILFESAKARIANFLIELALEQDLKQNGYHYVFLPFSLKVLSSFVGLKRQSASTIFNEFIKDNIIRKITQHEFIIVKFDELRNFTN